MAKSEPRMRELPKSTVRLLGSSQVITSVYSVVKELLENALDAGSTSVDVRLENFGLDKIEMRDNGEGIPTTDVPFVAKRYHTSKLSVFSDLEQLSTYGFRGEALGSLCTVADVSLTTKTKDDDIGMTYTFDKEGEIINTKPSHLTQGTTLCATHLFKNLPVRRQIYNNVKKKKEELKKVETLVMAFGLIFPAVRITLRHNKDLVWQKNQVQDLRASIVGVLGKNVVNQMEYKKMTSSDPEIAVEMYIPKSNSDPQVTSRSTADRCFIYVNSRPVILKDIEKLLKQYYTFSHSCEGTRVPVCCLSIILPSSQIDVNLDPNKTRVLLHHQVSVTTVIRAVLEEVYGPIEPSSSSGMKQKPKAGENSLQLSTIPGDQSLESSLDLSTGTNDHQDNTFTKITVVENTENCNKQIPIFKITMETDDSKQSDRFVVQDPVIPEESRVCSGKDSVLIDNHSNTIVIESDISGLEVPHVPTNIITPPVASAKKQEQITLIDEEIVKIQKGCFDIVGDCFKDVMNGDDSLCEVMEHIPGSQTKGHNPESQTNGHNPDSPTKGHNPDSPTKGHNPDSPTKGHNPDSRTKGHNPDSRTQFLEETNSDLFDDSLEDMLINIEKKTGEDILLVSSDSKLANDNSRSEVTPVGELWSKGQILSGSGGAVLQPVTLLSAGNSKRPLTSPPDLSPPSKRRSIVPEEGQPTLYDMVFSQPVQRGQTKPGYSVFVKENRPQVVAKNPTATFDEVTDILKCQWEELSPDHQQKYEGLTTDQSESCSLRQSVPSTKTVRQLGNKMKLNKSKPVSTSVSIKDQLMMAAERRKSRRGTVVSFSMENLRKTFSRQMNISQVPKSQRLNLIGHLKSCGTWTCCLQEKICILNCHRIQETVLYHQLMSDHVLPVESLEQPIRLTSQNVGGKREWDCLMSLDTNRFPGDMYSFITDERIVDNGFKVRCYTDKESGTSQAEVVAMTTFIPVYGIADLAEVLELICTSEVRSVSESRPLKVLNYLQGEAVRMARKSPPLCARDEVLELQDQMIDILPESCKVCLHNRPFCHPIYDLDDLPQTQSDMTQQLVSL